MNSGFYKQEKMIKMSSYASCILFLIAHVFYLVFFLITNVKWLIFINIGSATFYAILLLFIRFKLYNTYVILTALEIAVYMTIASLIVGIDAGFNLCLVALSTLVFFAGYFSKFTNGRIKPVIFGILYAALFAFIYIWFRFKEPLVTISDSAETVLYIIHIIFVFGFSVTFLAIQMNFTVKLEKQVQKAAETDRLTGIPNRNALAYYFDNLKDKNDYVLAMFDIDNFKDFNDVNGHLCGDYVLQEIARIVTENSNGSFCARWGGEEFIIIHKIDNDMTTTFKKIDKIREEVAEYNFIFENKVLRCTITIGVSLYQDGENIDKWISSADKKLYIGKQNGKNQTVI